MRVSQVLLSRYVAPWRTPENQTCHFADLSGCAVRPSIPLRQYPLKSFDQVRPSSPITYPALMEARVFCEALLLPALEDSADAAETFEVKVP